MTYRQTLIKHIFQHKIKCIKNWIPFHSAMVAIELYLNFHYIIFPYNEKNKGKNNEQNNKQISDLIATCTVVFTLGRYVLSVH